MKFKFYVKGKGKKKFPQLGFINIKSGPFEMVNHHLDNIQVRIENKQAAMPT